jgi:hypothetical protein
MRKGLPELFGIPVNEIARICHVDLVTARRWKRGATCPPKTALMLLSGDLACIHPAWAGWTIKRGLLCSPEGWEATPGHVRGLQMINATLAAYRSENASLKAAVRHLEAQASGFENQPEPGSWTIAIEG